MSKTTTEASIRILIPTKSTNKNEHVCGECDRIFKTKKECKDHICENTIAKPHWCKICGKRFKTKLNLSQHTRQRHGPKKFICDEGCGKTFIRKTDLEQHSMAHILYKPFRCKTCGKRFKAQNFLKNHRRVHKTDATFVRASEVVSKPKVSDSESDEESYSEPKVRVFTCDICNQHFKRNFNLKRHYTMHARSFPCLACVAEVSFKTPSERDNHYKTVHSGRPFKCGECFKAFRNKCYLKKHLTTHQDLADSP